MSGRSEHFEAGASEHDDWRSNQQVRQHADGVVRKVQRREKP